MKRLTLCELAAALNKLTKTTRFSAWEKGVMKRIYIKGAGYNTKKMSTKVFIDMSSTAPRLEVRIDCPSQSAEWIASQEDQVREAYFVILRYCRMYGPTSGNVSVESAMTNALLDAQEVQGYYTEWRNIRITINRFGKLADRNRLFVVPFRGTKATAPATFVPLTDAGYDFLCARNEDMLEPFTSAPDYDALPAQWAARQ